MHMFRVLMAALLLTGLAAAQSAAGKKETPKEVPSFDPKALDKTADPCVDFYQYSCGGWMKNNPIPSDQPAWGRFNELAERNRSPARDSGSGGKTRPAHAQRAKDRRLLRKLHG